MKNRINALVSGIGTIIGYGIINSLKSSKYEVNVIGMDMNPQAVGKHWCDEFIQAEAANSDGFIDFLKKIIDEKNIDIVFLGTEQEMKKISNSREELGEYLNKIVINNKDVIDLMDDKWETYLFLKERGLPYIESTLVDNYEELIKLFNGKFLVKPRRSYSSRGIKQIEDQITFDYYKYLLGNQFMAQRIVGDNEHEYTAAVFGYGDGTCSNSIILKRKLSFEGSTLTAEVVNDDAIDKSIRRLTQLLKVKGPTNFQYRVENGVPYLLEINPRVSSSTSIRNAFGFNEAEMAIEFYINKNNQLNFSLKQGKAIRYIADYIEFE